MSKYRQTFAEAYNSIYESAAAKEIDRTNTRKDSMDYKMYKKAVDLLRSKKYNELKTFLKKSDTAPREYVMSTIAKKEPATFKKMYGSQTGYYSLMNQVKEDYEVSMAVGQLKTIQDRVGKIMDFLSGKSDDYNMEAWLQSKITSAEDKLNSVANYVTNNPEVNEAKIPEIDKDNKPGVKIAKIRAMRDKEDGGDPTEKGKIGAAGKIALAKEKDQDALEAQIVDLKGKLALAAQQLENEKNKVVKPEPNPDTGEVPLRTGIANAILDKKKDTKDIKDLVQSKKKKEIKVGGKTNIEINPDVDIGNFSGGMKTNAGNLH